MNKKMDYFRIFIFYYLPIILWMGLIFYLSSIPGLSSGSESILVEMFLRKLAHISEYFILAILAWRIFYFHWKFSLFKIGVAVFCFCFLYAVTDEVHQFFVQDRAGLLIDVVVDSIGGTLAIFFSVLISKVKK